MKEKAFELSLNPLNQVYRLNTMNAKEAIETLFASLNPLNQVYRLNMLWRNGNGGRERKGLNPLNQVYRLNTKERFTIF